MSDDEFDEDFDDSIDEDPSFDDFGQENTIGDLWRNNPLVKVGAIVGVGILIFATIALVGGENDTPDTSRVAPGAQVSGAPGTEQTSDVYRQAIEEFNETEVERALRTGESTLPVPIEPPVGQIPTTQQDGDEEDPLLRWRRLQEERLQRELQQRQLAQTTPVDNSEETARDDAIQELADIMSQQMQSILESQNPESAVNTVQITNPSIFDPPPEVAPGAGAPGAGVPPGTDPNAQPEIVETILVPAGEIVYAQLITEASTDAPGPVLAQIASGPLAGSRILGSFTAQQEFLTLDFNTVVVDGVSLPVSAVGLDPDTTLPGLATEVDRRIFQRVILPMAADFVEGAAEAVADSGRLTVTIDGDTVAEDVEDADTREEIASGIEEAGEELGNILEELGGDIQILIRIESGTPLGILFLEPVVQQSAI